MAVIMGRMSKSAPITGAITGTLSGIFVVSMSWLLLFWFPLIPAILTLTFPISPLIGLTARRGKCPNCGRENLIFLGKCKCSSCKHRLELRKNRVIDLTGER